MMLVGVSGTRIASCHASIVAFAFSLCIWPMTGTLSASKVERASGAAIVGNSIATAWINYLSPRSPHRHSCAKIFAVLLGKVCCHALTGTARFIYQEIMKARRRGIFPGHGYGSRQVLRCLSSASQKSL